MSLERHDLRIIMALECLSVRILTHNPLNSISNEDK